MSNALNAVPVTGPTDERMSPARSRHLGSVALSVSKIGLRSRPLRLDIADVALCIVLDGEVTVPTVGSAVRGLPVGCAFFCGVREAGQLVSPSRGTVLIVAAPRQVFSQIPQVATDLTIVHDGGLLSPLTSFAQSLLAQQIPMSPTAGYFAERLLQEMLLGVAVDTVRSAPSTKMRDDPHVTALAMIDVRCGDSALSPAQVARDCRLSLRQLERVFARHGHTVSQAIRAARLRHAREMLTDPSYSALAIDQLARHAGFSGGSSLARAMRDEGWPSPSRLRAAASGAPRG